MAKRKTRADSSSRPPRFSASSYQARPAQRRALCSPSPRGRLPVDERAQPRSEPCSVVGGGGEISGIRCRPKRGEASVDLSAGGGLERPDEAVTDPFEHGDVPGHAVEILRRRVDTKLLRPQIEARCVDLRGGPVTKLKIEDVLREVDRLLLRPGS